MYKPSTGPNLSGHDLRRSKLFRRYFFPGTSVEKKINRAASAYAFAWAILAILLEMLLEVLSR
jgi:predicted KAP-like P-loop ATPase